MLDLGMLIEDGFQKDGGDEVGQGEKKSQGRKEKKGEEKEIEYLQAHGGEWDSAIWPDSGLGGRRLWLSQATLSLSLSLSLFLSLRFSVHKTKFEGKWNV